MINLDINQLIANNYFIFLIGFFGMITHFLKKYKFQRSSIKMSADHVWLGMYNYFFKLDIVNTMMTVICYIVGYFVAYQLGDTSIYAMFTTGYMSDSLFNRAEEKKLEGKKKVAKEI